jgi:transposase
MDSSLAHNHEQNKNILLRASEGGLPDAVASVDAPTSCLHQTFSAREASTFSAQQLVNEGFYRSFDNRRQVDSYFGLTSTPCDSGASRREQGISKAGNHRAR